MAEDVGAVGNEKAVKSGRGRIQVSLLDDTVVAFDIESKSKAEQLYQKVNSHLKVEESDYFGLQYYDSEGNMCWLDPQKAINKQVKEASKVTFKFRVMFYTPDPNSLQEYTKYLFTLQIRRDLLDGRLHCSEDTGSLLASYIVQGELGDYDPATHQDGYLSGFQFVPNQSSDIEERIITYHKNHRGKTPAEADRCMLDVARQLDMYGITLYPAKDRDDADLSLSVFHMGILVFQNQSKINMFSWAKIRKLSFKKKKFIIKLHPRVYSADLVEFVMQSRDACKGFWKICIAHHVFFRQRQSVQKKRKSSVLSRGSKYRYSGRTQKQLVEDSRESFRPTAELERNRASRIHRGSDAQTPIGSANSHELSILPTTPPPSYSSFKFETSPPEHNKSFSSFKNSTDASEDEGSFVIGSRKSSQQLENSKNGENTLDEGEVIEHGVVRLPRQNTNEDCIDGPDDSKLKEDDGLDLEGDDEIEFGRIRTDSDLEIERQVHSIMNDISKETSWQYHLTTTDLDDGDFIDENTGKPVNGEFDHVGIETEHVVSYEYTEPNGDLNANEVDEAAVENDDVTLQQKMKGIVMEQSYRKGRESESLFEEQDEGQDLDEEIETSMIESEIEQSLFENDNHIENGENPGKPHPMAYNIARELCLTERTYVKDLEVLTVLFREPISSKGVMSESLSSSLFGNIDPLYDFHCSFLAELEGKISLRWEDTSKEKTFDEITAIEDVLLTNMRNLKLFVDHINKLDELLLDFHKEMSNSLELSNACKEFELNKVCYVPLNTFLLKPAQRLLYYKSMLSRLCKESTNDGINFAKAKAAYEEVLDISNSVAGHTEKLENLHKLIELDRDLTGVENIVHPNREFVREGCLYKIGKKGPQQRMFFLFSDTLLYTGQGMTQTNKFRARSQIPLHSMKVEEGGAYFHGLFAFTIHYPDEQSIVVAATSEEERFKWMEDIKMILARMNTKRICPKCKANWNGTDGSSFGPVCPSCRNLPNCHLNIVIKKYGKANDSDDEEITTMETMSSLERNHSHTRTLSTRRVCWHRHTSISMNEYKTSVQNNFSGELYRKFKNQPKWQRLWVVFTNFSLFFFRYYEDDEPLASLPLIGFSVSKPSKDEDISDELAFKLHYKTHVYFFKAESQYSYTRWMEVLSSATKNASRSRIFSRLTST